MGFLKNKINKIKNASKCDDVYESNEISSNISTALLLLLFWFIIFVYALYIYFTQGDVDPNTFYLAIVVCTAMALIPSIVCFIQNGKGKYWRHVLIFNVIILDTFIYSIAQHTLCFIFVVPILFAARYWDKNERYVLFTTFGCVIGLLVSTYLSTIFGVADLSYVAFENQINEDLFISYDVADIDDIASYTYYLFVEQAIPYSILLVGCGALAISIATKGKRMVKGEADSAANNARIEGELSLAHNIQLNVLPKEFPLFPNKREFDAFAMMKTAKEVGGDFYDCFLIDDNHVCIVIADVSGKGVPASLFMMTAKAFIKSNLQLGLSLDQAINQTNKSLCDGNDAGLFVTAWIGVIELDSGKLQFVNAGHNSPLILHENKEFEFLKVKPNLMLGGLPITKYRLNEMTLNKGDKIVLYTDGVTESQNIKGELYGDDNFKNFVNSHGDLDVYLLTHSILDEVLRFTGKADLFDDITILSFDYSYHPFRYYKIYEPLISEGEKATKFVDDALERITDNFKIISSFNICLDELFSNAIKYGIKDINHKIILKIIYDKESKEFSIYLTYKSDKFNPWEDTKEPDFDVKKEDRKIGGLGIFIVKKMMDNYSYKYENGYSIIHISKKID